MALVRDRVVVGVFASVVGVVVAVSGCEGGAGPEPVPEGTTTSVDVPVWKEAESYAYTLDARLQILGGTFRVTVREGEVVGVVGLDEFGRETTEREAEYVPTIGEVMGRLRDARQQGAHVAEVVRAPDGQPTRVTLDIHENAIDDEAEYRISDYDPVVDQRLTRDPPGGWSGRGE